MKNRKEWLLKVKEAEEKRLARYKEKRDNASIEGDLEEVEKYNNRMKRVQNNIIDIENGNI